MDVLTIDQALDLGKGTLSKKIRKEPPLATYGYSTYQPLNIFFKNNLKTKGGKKLEGYVTLDSEDNAGHASVGGYEEDNLVAKNISENYEVKWRRATGGMIWSATEDDLNSGAEQIFRVWNQKWKSARKDIVDDIFSKVFGAPTSSTDAFSPYSVFTWLSCGTEATEGFTGYSAHYDDGVDVDDGSKTTFNKGGIASSASSNSDWASYYADHQGNLDDSLLTILDTAARELNFQPPVLLGNLPMEKVSFALYTSNNVIKNLNAFLRNSDDNMGYRPDGYFGIPTFKMIPISYCSALNTAKTDVYGTDPILGLNHNVIYPVIQKNWNFRITKQSVANHHLLNALYVDLLYAIWCETSPKYAGFLVSQHPASD